MAEGAGPPKGAINVRTAALNVNRELLRPSPQKEK